MRKVGVRVCHFVPVGVGTLLFLFFLSSCPSPVRLEIDCEKNPGPNCPCENNPEVDCDSGPVEAEGTKDWPGADGNCPKEDKCAELRARREEEERKPEAERNKSVLSVPACCYCTPEYCAKARERKAKDESVAVPACCYPEHTTGSVDPYWLEQTVDDLPEFDKAQPAGCTDPLAKHYDEDVSDEYDDGSCEYEGGFQKLGVKSDDDKDTYRNVFVEAFRSTGDGASAVTSEVLKRVEELVDDYSEGRNRGNRMIYQVIHPNETTVRGEKDPLFSPLARSRADDDYAKAHGDSGGAPVPFICVSQNLTHDDHQFYVVDAGTDDGLYNVVLRGIRAPHLVDIAIQPALRPSASSGVRIDVVVSFRMRDVKHPASGKRLSRKKGFAYRMFVGVPLIVGRQLNSASKSEPYRSKYPELYSAPGEISKYRHRHVALTELQSGRISSIKFLRGETVFTRKQEAVFRNLALRTAASIELTVIVFDRDRRWVWNVERTSSQGRVVWER